MFRWRHRASHGKLQQQKQQEQDEEEKEEDVRHEDKVNQLKAAFGSLSKRDSQFCDDSCLRRYLEARNWNVEKAKKMLEETIKWRSVYKPEEIRWHEVAIEGETGKVYRANFHDKEGRSVLVLRPARQNTTCQDNQLRHLVYLLENAILNLPEGLEQMVWLIDFTGWSLSKAVPIRTAKETTDVLQSHYPERLATAFLYNPPRIFETFWKIVKYFLDPKTSQKVKFIYPKNEESMELMRKNFDFSTLPVEFGGKMNYQYDHKDFSKLMSNDDIRMDALWRMDEVKTTSCNGHASPKVSPDSNHLQVGVN